MKILQAIERIFPFQRPSVADRRLLLGSPFGWRLFMAARPAASTRTAALPHPGIAGLNGSGAIPIFA
jgi:hypothetical protein